jgi:ketosteroid isomerase-like protein
MNRKLIFMLLTIIMFSCKEKKVDTKAEAEKLMQLSREWSKHAAGRDVDKIVSYWSDEAVLFSNGHPTVTGKNELKKMVEESMNIPGFKISWEPVKAEVSESGDMAYIIEKNEITMPDSTGKPFVMKGNVVTVWKKNVAGEWKAVVDISSDQAAQ